MTAQRLIESNARHSVTLRWDVSQVFNTTNFGLPNRNLSDATTLGTIRGFRRRRHLAVRFGF